MYSIKVSALSILILSSFGLKAQVKNLDKAAEMKKSAVEMIGKLDGKQEQKVNGIVGAEVDKTFDQALDAIKKSMESEDDSMTKEEALEKSAALKTKRQIGNIKNRIYAFSGRAGLTASQGIALKHDIGELLHKEVGLIYLSDLKDNIARYKEIHEQKRGEIVAPIIASLISDLDAEIKRREAAGEKVQLSNDPFERKIDLLTVFKSAYGVCPVSSDLRWYLSKEVNHVDFYNEQNALLVEAVEKDDQEALASGRLLTEAQIQEGIDLSITNIDNLLNSCSAKSIAEEKAVKLLDSSRKDYKTDALAASVAEIAKEVKKSVESFKKYKPHNTKSN